MAITNNLINFYESLRRNGFGHKDSFELAEFAQNHYLELEKQYQVERFYTSVYLVMRRTLDITESEVFATEFVELAQVAAEDSFC